MPLTPLQTEVLSLLAAQRSPTSHIAGATGLLMSPRAPRRSHDVDLFHDAEEEVARVFAADRTTLEAHGIRVAVILSQPGFIRAEVRHRAGEILRMDWAHDSRWRFLPPVRVQNAGYVLHPVDLAVNKALALAGRDEPRDFVDLLYLLECVLPLGALVWASVGKDPGLNPIMLLDLLARKGRIEQREIDRLDLAHPFAMKDAGARYRAALQEARVWITTRDPEEAGCLYQRPDRPIFFAPNPGDNYRIHRGAPGGVLPTLTDNTPFFADPVARAELETFFDRPLRE
jgi:hypothetical protein